jgi:hypothetical protein
LMPCPIKKSISSNSSASLMLLRLRNAPAH